MPKNFQKNSPYLQDFNFIVDLMNQMDLEFSTNRIHNYTPNSTKCMTWRDVKASHKTDNPEVIIVTDHVYGTIVLLAIGLGGALTVLILELLMKAQNEGSQKNIFANHGKLSVMTIFPKIIILFHHDR